jgi:hypothetical protein
VPAPDDLGAAGEAGATSDAGAAGVGQSESPIDSGGTSASGGGPSGSSAGGGNASTLPDAGYTEATPLVGHGCGLGPSPVRKPWGALSFLLGLGWWLRRSRRRE